MKNTRKRHKKIPPEAMVPAEEVPLPKALAQPISGPEGAKENSPVLSEAMHRVRV